MKWPSHHVNAIQNQKVIPVWNSCRSDFSHVNTPSDAYLLLAPDYMISDFHCGTKFVFSPHDTRMKLHTRARISFRLKTGMNSFWLEWLEWELNVTLVSCEQIQRNINYEDDMNLFQNENHSINLWIAPYWLCVYTDCIAAFLPGSLRMC